MGEANGLSSQLSGKVGMVVFRQLKNGKTVVLENKKKKGVPRRSEKQMRVRMQWGNLGAIYTQFRETLKRAFEGIGSKMSDYNAFIQSNVGVCKVYIPKKMLLNGGCVLAPYQITRVYQRASRLTHKVSLPVCSVNTPCLFPPHLFV